MGDIDVELLAWFLRVTVTDAHSILVAHDRSRAYGLRMAAWEAAVRIDEFQEFAGDAARLANDLRDMAESLHSYDAPISPRIAMRHLNDRADEIEKGGGK